MSDRKWKPDELVVIVVLAVAVFVAVAATGWFLTKREVAEKQRGSREQAE